MQEIIQGRRRSSEASNVDSLRPVAVKEENEEDDENEPLVPLPEVTPQEVDGKASSRSTSRQNSAASDNSQEMSPSHPRTAPPSQGTSSSSLPASRSAPTGHKRSQACIMQ